MRFTPLRWPDGWPRGTIFASARFDVTLDKATRELLWEIERLGGQCPNITHNRFNNGRDPHDPAVAVYFEMNGKQRVFACDRWSTVKDNIRAISKTIEAMRGVERWGASSMMDRVFAAFDALPAPSWRRDLGFTEHEPVTESLVEARFKELAKKHHPDRGGDEGAFKAINKARMAALESLKEKAA